MVKVYIYGNGGHDHITSEVIFFYNVKPMMNIGTFRHTYYDVLYCFIGEIYLILGLDYERELHLIYENWIMFGLDDEL